MEPESVSSTEQIVNAVSLEDPPQPTYQVYKKRWLLLILLCLLQITNAMNWICFAPKSDQVAEYLNVQVSDVDMFSLVYMLAFVFAIPTNYAMQKWGLRFAMLAGSVVNAFGVCFRLLSIVFPDYAYALILAGQSIAALTQPAFMLSTTVLAATWFSESERTAANSIASLSNLLGILVANGFTLFILVEPEDTRTLLISFSLPAVIPFVFAVLLLHSKGSDIPPSPPSPSAAMFMQIDHPHTTPAHAGEAAENNEHWRVQVHAHRVRLEHESVPFHKGVKNAMRKPAFLHLFWSIGVGFGVFNSLLTINNQIFCARGYPDWFAAVVACTMIGSGFVGALFVGWLIDSSNRASLEEATHSASRSSYRFLRVRIDEVYTVLWLLTTIAFTAFALLSAYPGGELQLLLLSSVFGFLAFPLFPLSLELGLECTFPNVSEATSSTLLIAGGQVHGVVYVLLSTSLLSSPITGSQTALSTCRGTDPPLDFVPFSTFLFLMVGCTSVLFTVFFRGKLKRTEFDRLCRVEQLADQSQPNVGSSPRTHL